MAPSVFRSYQPRGCWAEVPCTWVLEGLVKRSFLSFLQEEAKVTPHSPRCSGQVCCTMLRGHADALLSGIVPEKMQILSHIPLPPSWVTFEGCVPAATVQNGTNTSKSSIWADLSIYVLSTANSYSATSLHPCHICFDGLHLFRLLSYFHHCFGIFTFCSHQCYSLSISSFLLFLVPRQ